MAALPFIPQVNALVRPLLPFVPNLVSDPYSALNWAGFLVMTPAVIRLGLQYQAESGYDNIHPRLKLQKHLDVPGVISRVHAAHENSMESFQYFAAGILAAAQVFVTPEDRSMLCKVASLHLIARASFIGLYMFHKEGQDWISGLRSSAWVLGTMCSAFLMVAAGAKYAKLFP